MINKRRTIRKYTQQPISDELLNQLIEEASRTQTMGNLQLYSVVVTRSAEMKQRLAPAHFNQSMVTEAPVVLTICADFRRTTDWCLCRKANPGYDNFLSFVNATTDALLFTQTLSVLAEQEGLGVCFLGTTIYQPQVVCDVLELPELVMPVATLTIGWPDEEPAQTERLPLTAIRHDEHYLPYSPMRIDECYAYKEALPTNQHFVEINQKETLAQVFTDLRYTRHDNEALSANLIQTLHEQGFLSAQSIQAMASVSVTETRPEVLECDVVRFQNNKEKWVAFVGLLNERPYEIFTGIMDDEEGIMLPKSVTKGRIIKVLQRDGTKRYDFQFQNKRGYKTTIEGLSEKFNPDCWNYAKLISGVLRYSMPIDHVVRLVSSLSLNDESLNTWKKGVTQALKKYIPGQQGIEDEV